MKRRKLLGYLMASAGVLAATSGKHANALQRRTGWPDHWPEQFAFERSEAEWLDQLGQDRFLILRKEQTEKPYVSSLNDEYGQGHYACVGCDLPVYSSRTKYDSETGWPSFYEAIAGATLTRDSSRGFGFKEQVVCSRCGGHLGHIFDDGPDPTGLRHCINGLALSFIPAETDAQ